MNPLSFEPLTALSFLDRAAATHGKRVAVVDGEQRWTYEDLHDRCQRLAGALVPLAAGRPVAVLAPNTHVVLRRSRRSRRADGRRPDDRGARARASGRPRPAGGEVRPITCAARLAAMPAAQTSG